MKRIAFTPRARRDVEGIWDYSLERFGVERAEAYVREVQRAVATIAEDPRRGRPCDEIRADYRKFAAGSHVLLLRAWEGGFVIVRILLRRIVFDRHLK